MIDLSGQTDKIMILIPIKQQAWMAGWITSLTSKGRNLPAWVRIPMLATYFFNFLKTYLGQFWSNVYPLKTMFRGHWVKELICGVYFALTAVLGT